MAGWHAPSHTCHVVFIWATFTHVPSHKVRPAWWGRDQDIRRIKTEEKAKVVAANWGKELIQFLACPSYFAPG